MTRFFYGGKSHGHPNFLERKNNQIQLNFNVFNDVDNRERTKMLDKNCWKKKLVVGNEEC